MWTDAINALVKKVLTPKSLSGGTDVLIRVRERKGCRKVRCIHP